MKKIIIVGNIGAGKTTVAKLLAKRMNLEHVELDEFRRKHNQGRTLTGEERAREMFKRKLSRNESQIIELTGSGKVWQETIDHLSEKDLMIIKLTCPESILIRRMKTRLKSKYNFPPLPIEWKMSHDLASLTDGIQWIGRNIIADPDMTISTVIFTPAMIAKIITSKINEN